jgi:two-component system sensor kinase FixL
MVTAACVTMGLIHLRIGLRRRPGAAHLLFTVTAFVVAAFSCVELAMIRADSPAQFWELQRWIDFGAAAMLVSLTGFVWVFFGTGRKWLALLGSGLVLCPMILNLGPEPKLTFLQVTGIRMVETFGGATYAVAEGMSNSWLVLFYLGVFVTMVFVADASVTLWRRGARHRSALVGGAIIFFLLAAGTQAALVDTGIMATPYLVSFFYLFILVAMGMELSDDVLHAAQLAADLRESEERMSLATQAGGIGLWIWDPGANQVWGSKRWLELFELGAQPNVAYERVVGRIHPDDREQVDREARRAVADRIDYIGEFRLIGEDGAERWIGAQAKMSPDMNGKPVRMMGAAIEITARKQAEQKIDQQRRELAHLSRITMLSELSGSLAHELNQPLAIILSNAQAAQRLMAQEPPDLAEVRDILADIVGEDERAGEVIRRMRAMLKHGEAELEPLILSEVIAEVLHLVNSDLIGRGVIVRRTFAPDVPRVLGDRIQLQQVLLNLILNACDAMDANPRMDRFITIATEYRNEMVCTSVSDNGCGIPAEVERVFEPFHTSKNDGLGLGLSICRSIVSVHHGRLWAERNEARGATFHIELPAIKEAHS